MNKITINKLERISGVTIIPRMGEVYIEAVPEELLQKVAYQVLGRTFTPEDGPDFTIAQSSEFPGKLLVSYKGFILGRIQVGMHESGEHGEYKLTGDFYPNINTFQ